MNMIHPMFDRVPDKATAEIWSEIMQPGYNYYGGYSDVEYHKQQAVATFPPAPAHISAIGITYLRNGNLKSQFAELDPNLVVADEISEAYASRVAELQALFPDADKTFGALGYSVMSLYRELMAKTGKRVAAAFVVGRVASSNMLVDALIYPEIINESFPLVLREAIVDTLAASPDPDSEADRQLREGAADIIRMNSRAKDVGAIVASGFMPPLEEFKAGLARLG